MNAYKGRGEAIGVTETQKHYLGCCKEIKAKSATFFFFFNLKLVIASSLSCKKTQV